MRVQKFKYLGAVLTQHNNTTLKLRLGYRLKIDVTIGHWI